MKPMLHRNMSVEERVFNYRLLRTQRVIEIHLHFWLPDSGAFLTTMPQSPDRVSTIILASCVLHNILRLKNPTMSDVFSNKKVFACISLYSCCTGYRVPCTNLPRLPPVPLSGLKVVSSFLFICVSLAFSSTSATTASLGAAS